MSKYHNTKEMVNGRVFDSMAEAARYRELLIMEKAGLIRDLRCQVRYQLTPTMHIGRETLKGSYYTADFVYREDGQEVIEDVKGVRTPLFILKKKVLAYRYGVLVREVLT